MPAILTKPRQWLRRQPSLGYLLATIACLVVTLLAWPLSHWLAAANIVMLFLLTVFLVAYSLGRGPAMLAAFLCVALFDYFFVQPRHSFAVADAQYLVTFAVMLLVALFTGQLVARLGQRADEALAREAQTRGLYEMARELAGALSTKQVEESCRRFLQQRLQTSACLLLPDADEQLQRIDLPASEPIDLTLPRRAYRNGEPIEVRGFSGRGEVTLYLPLRTPMRTRGVLQVSAASETLHLQRPLLDAVASLAAIAIERLHYVEVARAAEMRSAAESLRNSVLSTLSHDLRTPLTALRGLADTLLVDGNELSRRESALALSGQAQALSRMVDNLLDLARLAAGGQVLRRDWQPLEEVAGAAIQWLGNALQQHPLTVNLPADLPLLNFDAVLVERVIGNLLENAAKYSPAGSPISLSARLAPPEVEIRVCDRGPGFPPGLEMAEAFSQGTPGRRPGLGLITCKTIVEAHGGRLGLERPDDGGACVCFSLPLGTPPAIEIDEP